MRIMLYKDTLYSQRKILNIPWVLGCLVILTAILKLGYKVIKSSKCKFKRKYQKINYILLLNIYVHDVHQIRASLFGGKSFFYFGLIMKN